MKTRTRTEKNEDKEDVATNKKRKSLLKVMEQSKKSYIKEQKKNSESEGKAKSYVRGT